MPPKRKCCCPKCTWCDHDHWEINTLILNPSSIDPVFQQNAQPNWNVIGTVTTELPSVGHPMTKPTYVGCDSCQLPEFLNTACCENGGLLTPSNITPAPSAPFIQNENFRTPITDVETTAKLWGDASRYGDIQPCWFNGINMSNIYEPNEEFLRFKFKLKIEKLESNGSYSTVVDIDRFGPGLNLRPHPDACGSYNVNDSLEWTEATQCEVFNSGEDELGNYLPIPCFRDFAKMPRGPWPYRFQRKLDIDAQSPSCYGSNGIPYSGVDVLRAQKAYNEGGTAGFQDFLNSGTVGENGAIFDEEILNCIITLGECASTTIPDNRNCCPENGYLPWKTELCTQLDVVDGTPFGWEDVPYACPALSNYGNTLPAEIPPPTDVPVINPVGDGGYTGGVTGYLHFFGWIGAANRYTTPEWDFYAYENNGGSSGASGASGASGGVVGLSSNSKKLSLHVLVPHEFDDFCSPFQGSVEGQSFGEWSFGMDYQAEDEILALENAGYVWSNGREDDGVWINKTPTGALRVLFTLDHSDLGQGKVWRVFRDWHVTVDNLEKTFNLTTSPTTFRISLQQIVEEVQVVSLGCDCPSGYTIEDGQIIPIEPACDEHVYQYTLYPPPGFTYPPETFTEPEVPSLPCWQSFIDGKFSPGSFEQSTNIGNRLSFSERGPLMVQTVMETESTGCQMCNTAPDEYPGYCDFTFGSRSSAPDGYEDGSSVKGQVFIVNGPNVSPDYQVYTNSFSAWPTGDYPIQEVQGSPDCLTACWGDSVLGCEPNPYGFVKPPQAIRNVFKRHGARYNNALADIPKSFGYGSVAVTRYRNVYNAVETSPTVLSLSAQGNEWNNFEGTPSGEEIWGYWPFFYGTTKCKWTAQACPRPDSVPAEGFKYAHSFAGVFVDQWPTAAKLGNCKIFCDCGARELITLGVTYDPEIGPPGISVYIPPEGDSGPPEFGLCPCDIPTPGPIDFRENIGPYILPFYVCGPNLIQRTSGGPSDYFYTCNPIVRQGEHGWFCYGEYLGPQTPLKGPMGIDSDRFYYSHDGLVTVNSGVGNPNCASICTCPTINSGQGGACRYDVQVGPNQFVRKCDFCESPAHEFSIGFPRNSFLNWRKYLCRARVEGQKIHPDFMKTFTWRCDSAGVPEDCEVGGPDLHPNGITCGLVLEKGPSGTFVVTGGTMGWYGPTGSSGPSSGSTGTTGFTSDGIYPAAKPSFCPCDHAWAHKTPCILPPGTAADLGNNSYSEVACNLKSSFKGLKPVYQIGFEKYNLSEDNEYWCPWDTTYEPNPARELLPNGRKYIIIDAKGPF